MTQHYAVTGRNDGDDEDSCLLTEAESKEDAIAQFEEWIKDNGRETYDGEEEVPVYLNYVLASDTPIKIITGPYG